MSVPRRSARPTRLTTAAALALGALVTLGACSFSDGGVGSADAGAADAVADALADQVAPPADTLDADAAASGDTGVDGASADGGPAADGGDGGPPSVPPPPPVASKDGWVLRAPLTSQGTRLRAVWGSGPSDVWAVGSAGQVLHLDGQRWTRVDYTTVKEDLYGVAGHAADDVWIVGAAGRVLRYDGTGTLKTETTPSKADLRAVVVPAAGAVFAAGAGGALLRRTSGGWVDDSSVISTDIEALWAASPAAVFAAGASGTVLLWDGTKWSQLLGTNTTRRLYAIHGFSAKDVWVAGEFGTLVRFDGAKFSAVSPTPPTTQTLEAIWGSGPNDVWVAGRGSTLMHFDGKTWTNHPRPELNTTVGSLWGASANEIYAVGTSSRLYRYDGTRWVSLSVRMSTSFTAVAGRPAWMVGSAGAAWRETYGAFEAMEPPTVVTLRAVWVTPARVWVGGDVSTVQVFDGAKWLSIGAPPPSYRGLWSDAQGRAWAVGSFGAAKRRENNLWKDYTSGFGTTQIEAVYGFAADDVWIVGAGGRIRRFDGSTFSTPPFKKAVTETLRAVWGASSTDVWAVGHKGTALRWDGTQWDEVDPKTGEDLVGVGGRSATEVWAVGAKGVVTRWDGSAFKALDSGTTVDLRGVWGDARSVIAVGASGMVIERP